MTDFTPEELRTAAKVVESAFPFVADAYHFRTEADRIEAEQTDNAYLDELAAVFAKPAPSHREGMRAVLAKLEADGRLIDPDKLTRVAVIDHREETPLQYDRRTQGVMVSVRDRGRTLKLFTGRGAITPGPNLWGPWSDWREVPEGIPFVWGSGLSARIIHGEVEIQGRDGFWRRTDVTAGDLDGYAPFHRVPRVWNEGDPEPEGVTQVRDAEGETWTFRPEYGSWAAEPYQSAMWGGLTKAGPVTEVLPEETNR